MSFGGLLCIMIDLSCNDWRARNKGKNHLNFRRLWILTAWNERNSETISKSNFPPDIEAINLCLFVGKKRVNNLGGKVAFPDADKSWCDLVAQYYFYKITWRSPIFQPQKHIFGNLFIPTFSQNVAIIWFLKSMTSIIYISLCRCDKVY